MIPADKALFSHRQNSNKPIPSGMGFFLLPRFGEESSQQTMARAQRFCSSVFRYLVC